MPTCLPLESGQRVSVDQLHEETDPRNRVSPLNLSPLPSIFSALLLTATTNGTEQTAGVHSVGPGHSRAVGLGSRSAVDGTRFPSFT